MATRDTETAEEPPPTEEPRRQPCGGRRGGLESGQAATDRDRASPVGSSAARRRDEKMSALRAALRRTRSELEELRRVYEADARLHSLREDVLREDNARLREEIEALSRDMDAEVLAVKFPHLAESVGSHEEIESRLRRKLFGAVHLVEALMERVKVMKRGCDERIRSLESEVADLVREKGRREAKLAAEVWALQEEMRVLNEKHETELRRKQETIQGLEAKLFGRLQMKLRNEVSTKPRYHQSTIEGLKGRLEAKMRSEVLTQVHDKRCCESDSSKGTSSETFTASKRHQTPEIIKFQANRPAGRKPAGKQIRREEIIALMRKEIAVSNNRLDLPSGGTATTEAMTESECSCSDGDSSHGREVAAPLLVRMGSLSKLTETLESVRKAGVRNREQVMKSLSDEQITSPDVVASSPRL